MQFLRKVGLGSVSWLIFAECFAIDKVIFLAFLFCPRDGWVIGFRNHLGICFPTRLPERRSILDVYFDIAANSLASYIGDAWVWHFCRFCAEVQSLQFIRSIGSLQNTIRFLGQLSWIKKSILNIMGIIIHQVSHYLLELLLVVLIYKYRSTRQGVRLS